MRHRHLNHHNLTLAAIDDIISRGKLADWLMLREAARQDHLLGDRILRICQAHIADAYAQRYHFWYHYVQMIWKKIDWLNIKILTPAGINGKLFERLVFVWPLCFLTVSNKRH